MSYDRAQLTRDLDPSRKKRPVLILDDGNWGEPAWKFLYSSVLAFEGDIQDLHCFLKSLQKVLPCQECKEHYEKYLSSNPLPNSLAGTFGWLQSLENLIRKRQSRRPIQRLDSISKISTVTKKQDRVKPKKRNKEAKQGKYPCKNCHRTRASMGVTTQSMGLGKMGSGLGLR